MVDKKFLSMTVRMNQGMVDRLDKVANDLSMNRSAVMNYAIGQFLRQQEVGTQFAGQIADRLSKELQNEISKASAIAKKAVQGDA